MLPRWLTEKGSSGRQLALSFGVLVCFSLSSLAQESLTSKREARPEGFNYERFLVFWQSASASIIAILAIVSLEGGDQVIKERKEDEVPWRVKAKEWFIVIAAYYASHFFGLSSLRHLSYPVHVTFKSCKAIPVAIGERVLTNRRHPPGKTLGVVVMSLGVALFFLSDKRKSSKQQDTEILGILFVSLALLADGIYAASQVALVQRCTSEFYLMLHMNAWQTLLALLSSLLDHEFFHALDAISQDPSIFRDLLAFAFCKSLGTLCVYRLLRESGTLLVATVTTIRKVLTVSLSCLAFGHSLAPLQCLALLAVFCHTYIGNFILSSSSFLSSSKSRRRRPDQPDADSKAKKVS